jgi:hypothetical protein
MDVVANRPRVGFDSQDRVLWAKQGTTEGGSARQDRLNGTEYVGRSVGHISLYLQAIFSFLR